MQEMLLGITIPVETLYASNGTALQIPVPAPAMI